jgi:hypothetical protein
MNADAGETDGATRPIAQPPQYSYLRSSAFIRGKIFLPSAPTGPPSPSAGPRPAQLARPNPTTSHAHRQRRRAARPDHANSPPQRLRPERKNARRTATMLRPTAPHTPHCIRPPHHPPQDPATLIDSAAAPRGPTTQTPRHNAYAQSAKTPGAPPPCLAPPRRTRRATSVRRTTRPPLRHRPTTTSAPPATTRTPRGPPFAHRRGGH